jgi:hypothetical protein
LTGCNEEVAGYASWRFSDQSFGVYHITNAINNSITVTEIDTIANLMSGHFEMKMALEKRWYDFLPDTLHIKGSFSGKIRPY